MASGRRGSNRRTEQRRGPGARPPPPSTPSESRPVPLQQQVEGPGIISAGAVQGRAFKLCVRCIAASLSAKQEPPCCPGSHLWGGYLLTQA
jgi:hypothetical protein